MFFCVFCFLLLFFDLGNDPSVFGCLDCGLCSRLQDLNEVLVLDDGIEGMAHVAVLVGRQYGIQRLENVVGLEIPNNVIPLLGSIELGMVEDFHRLGLRHGLLRLGHSRLLRLGHSRLGSQLQQVTDKLVLQLRHDLVLARSHELRLALRKQGSLELCEEVHGCSGSWELSELGVE